MGPELKSSPDFKKIVDHRWTPDPQSDPGLQVDPGLTKSHGLLQDPGLQVHPGSTHGPQITSGPRFHRWTPDTGGSRTIGKPQFTGGPRVHRKSSDQNWTPESPVNPGLQVGQGSIGGLRTTRRLRTKAGPKMDPIPTGGPMTTNGFWTTGGTWRTRRPRNTGGHGPTVEPWTIGEPRRCRWTPEHQGTSDFGTHIHRWTQDPQVNPGVQVETRLTGVPRTMRGPRIRT